MTKFIVKDKGEYWLAEGEGTTRDKESACKYTREELKNHHYRDEFNPNTYHCAVIIPVEE